LQKLIRPFLLLTVLCGLASFHGVASAQGNATAEQTLRLSAFGGFTGTYTGLSGGRNGQITAGVDLGFQPYRFIRPSLEVRGSYPVDDGHVDSQRNVLGGFRFDIFHLNKVSPYVDVMFGRGDIHYAGNGYPAPGQDFTYIVSDGNVVAFGGGAEIPAEGRLAIKLDFQLQRYAAPVTTSGELYAKAATAGVTYRFDFNHHPKQLR
jgi:hypothetical protein